VGITLNQTTCGTSNHRPIQHRIKLAQFPQRSVQDVEPRLPPEVEDPEQVLFLRDVFRASDFIARDVERKELAQAGRLDLQFSLGIIGVVKRDNVEAQAVTGQFNS
jgi:hypothetical protein